MKLLDKITNFRNSFNLLGFTTRKQDSTVASLIAIPKIESWFLDLPKELLVMTDYDPAFITRKRVNLGVRCLWEKWVVDEQNLVGASAEHFADALIDVSIYQQSHSRQKTTGKLCRPVHTSIQAATGGWRLERTELTSPKG